MRAGLSTIQQTLTPEASTILNHSISEAGRRNHGQTTPLHVAATLLASPSGFLRQACIRSHPNSSHPLQCRALELCFSVALERLPTAQNMPPGTEPPISNALMAALKRAQAHQRRGCPEQQQQPLLAVKVELEQLIISILDDPSVSRVMREASFSSPAVKAAIEQSMNSTSGNVNQSNIGIGFRPNNSLTPVPLQMTIPKGNMYLNPRLQQGNSAQPGNQRNDEVKKVLDILQRSTKKRNPVLVGESEPEALAKEVFRRIENGELGDGPLKNVQVMPIEKELASDKTQIPLKLKELGVLIESRIGDSSGGGIILDLGDLKWLVEQPVAQPVVTEAAHSAVAEMAKLIERFGDGSGGKIWLMGTATCETYLRCQVYHPSMENDWDLQTVPIASRLPFAGTFPRLGSNGVLSSSVESLNPLKSFPAGTTNTPRQLSESLDRAQKLTCCPQCSENYQQELAKLIAKKFDESSSEIETEAARPALPQWLQNAKVPNSNTKTTDRLQLNKDQESLFMKKSEEIQKKWNDTCSQFHPSYHCILGPERITPTALSVTGLGLYNPKLLVRQPFEAKLTQIRNLGNPLQLNSQQIPSQLSQPKLQPTINDGESLQSHASSPPSSPVRTDLFLGPTKVAENSSQNTNGEPVVKNLLGYLSSQPNAKFNQVSNDKFADALDADSFKKLLKGLMEKAWWQPEAASAVATTVTQCKLGHGKRQGTGAKGNNIWLLFSGPDRVGKKKMASVLSEHVCGASPVMICLGSRRDDEELDLGFRGKTALDRIAEAVRRNPFSVVMLEDIDETNMLVRGSIRRAIEKGRLTDSHGREISLGNVIFILTGNWSTCNLDENKVASIGRRGWQLRLKMVEKSGKRRANWLHNAFDRQTKARKEMGSGLCLDLNQVADAEDDRIDHGSNNSSDLINDHEQELGLDNGHGQFSVTSVPHELVNSVDAAIVFKPANFEFICHEIEKTIKKTFFTTLDHENLCVEVQEDALQKIVGGLWFGRTSLQEWAERVLVPTVHQLKSHSSPDETVVVRLESDPTASDTENDEDWLPSAITVMADRVRD